MFVLVQHWLPINTVWYVLPPTVKLSVPQLNPVGAEEAGML
jgi:hypothetical protein